MTGRDSDNKQNDGRDWDANPDAASDSGRGLGAGADARDSGRGGDAGLDADYKRLCWHSRRGMLELDLVLEPFVKQRYLALDPQDQARYRRLLDCEDQQLFAWLLGRETPEDENLARIVGLVLEHARADAAPAKTSSASPAGTSSASPAKTSSASPAGTSSASPAKTSSASPAGTAFASPAADLAETSPVPSTATIPAPAPTPTPTPTPAPAPTPAPTPTPTPTPAPTATASPTTTSPTTPKNADWSPPPFRIEPRLTGTFVLLVVALLGFVVGLCWWSRLPVWACAVVTVLALVLGWRELRGLNRRWGARRVLALGFDHTGWHLELAGGEGAAGEVAGEEGAGGELAGGEATGEEVAEGELNGGERVAVELAGPPFNGYRVKAALFCRPGQRWPTYRLCQPLGGVSDEQWRRLSLGLSYGK